MNIKTILSLTTLSAALITADAQVIVLDPTAVDQLILQLARQGDPAAIQRLSGWDELQKSLGAAGVGTSLEKIRRNASGVNAFDYDGAGIYRAVQDAIQLPNGEILPRLEETYRKFDALTAASENYQAVQENTETRRAELEKQIRATTAGVQSATTEAEVAKLKAVLAAQSALLNSLDQERQAAAARVAIQEAENRNDAARQRQAHAEDQSAAFEQANDSLTHFLTPDTRPVLVPVTHHPRN